MAFKKLKKFLKRVTIIPATKALAAIISCLPPVAFRCHSRRQAACSPTPGYTKMIVTEEITFYPDKHHDYSWARRLRGDPERLVLVFDRESSTPEAFAAIPGFAEMFRGIGVRVTRGGEECEVFCAESNRWIGRSSWSAFGGVVAQFWELRQEEASDGGHGTRVRCLLKSGVKGGMLAVDNELRLSLRERIGREGSVGRNAPSAAIGHAGRHIARVFEKSVAKLTQGR